MTGEFLTFLLSYGKPQVFQRGHTLLNDEGIPKFREAHFTTMVILVMLGKVFIY